MTFVELKQQVQAAATTGTLELDASAIAAELAAPFQDLLRTVKLKLDRVKVPQVTDGQIRVSGTYRLPAIDRRRGGAAIAVEATFAESAGAIAYTFAFSPTDHWLQAISGDLRDVVELLPVDLDALWFTLSSVAVPHARIEIPGREIADAAIAAGRGYLFRFRSRVLKLLELDDTVFSLLERTDPLRFTTGVRVPVRIPPVLELTVERLSLNGAQSVEIEGQGKLELFGGSFSCRGKLAMSGTGFSFSLPVQDFVAGFDRAFFRSLRLSNTVASFSGTLSAYTVGMSGDFAIAGSGHGGRYEFKYLAGGTSSIPDLFELSADRLTLSDAFTVMSGATVTLPEFLDRLIVLERTYLYYATRDGIPTESGVPSRQGARAHSDARLLGYAAYAEVVAVGDSQRAKLLLSPIRLGGIIEIRGSGERPPRGWAGSRVDPNGFGFTVDSSRMAGTADIRVELLDQAAVECVATLAEQSLDFDIPLELPAPLGTLRARAALRPNAISVQGTFDLSLAVELKTARVRFELVKNVELHGSVRLEGEGAHASGRVEVSGRVGPLPLPSITFAVDPRELEKVPELIRDRVTAEVERLFADAERWLQAVLDGTIRTLSRVGEVLQTHFKKTEKEAAKLLKRAGYTVERAAEALNVRLDDMLETLTGPDAFSERELADAFARMVGHTVPEYTAREVAGLLLHNGMAPAAVTEHVTRMLTDPRKVAQVLGQLDFGGHEIAEFLRKNRIGPRETALLVAGIFPFFQEEELRDALRFGGYVATEAASVANNIFRESARAVENVRNEIQRAWDRYVPRFKW